MAHIIVNLVFLVGAVVAGPDSATRFLHKLSPNLVTNGVNESSLEPMDDMVEILCHSQEVSVGSWKRLGGANLVESLRRASSDDLLAWKRVLAVVLLASEIVDGLTLKERAGFLKSSGVSGLVTKKSKVLVGWIFNEFSGKDDSFRNVSVDKRRREQLLRAPLWKLDVVAPGLISYISVARVVFHHKALRELLKEKWDDHSLLPTGKAKTGLGRVAWTPPHVLVRYSFNRTSKTGQTR